jgi:hypothetical protein
VRRLCAGVSWVYAALCVVSLADVPASGFGLFRLEPNPMAALFAVVLALPWSLVTPHLLGDAGVAAGLAAFGVGMAVNAAILHWLCRRLR